MERPSWALFVVTSFLPREFTDLLAVASIGLAGFQASTNKLSIAGYELGLLTLYLSIPSICTLASLSGATRRLREELALFAYGGAAWQVWTMHFLRGFTCCLVALSPFVAVELIAAYYVIGPRSLQLLVASVVGGAFYSGPALRRLRSTEFAENYKA
jgi:hypothetical protein